MASLIEPYFFEVWSPDDNFVADISELATSRNMQAGRNKGGAWSFALDTHQLRLLAATYGTNAASILNEGINELRVRRGDTYLRQGGRIDISTHTGADIEKRTAVQVTGFLDLLAQRYYEKLRVFNSVQAATLLWTVINEMQTASANFWDSSLAAIPDADDCDFGITQGDLDLTIGTKDRTYEVGKNVLDILVQMTQVQTTDTDVEIDHLKRLHVQERQGADRPQVVFELGRNIIDYQVPRDAKDLANRVITYGAGTGEDARVQSIVQDATSQGTYKVRQHVQQFNSVQEVDTLDDHGEGYLAATKDPISLPTINVDLNVDFTITDFWIGDRITVRIIDEDLPIAIEGLYKVEQIDLEISDEGSETAKLTLSA